MAERLRGKVIAIVGGSTGMGLAVATLCAAEGAEVVMMARSEARLRSEAQQIGATAIPCDAADPDSVRKSFAEIDDRFGRLDALLNVAGVARIRKIADATDEDIAYVMGVNLLGPIYTTRSAIPLLRAAGGGDIINVSSEITGDYLPSMVLYGVSKGGLDTFSKMMVHELKAEKIRVSNFVSGTVSTEFGSNFEPEEAAAAMPEWAESGYMDRVAGPPMDPSWMAEAMVFELTRPAGQMIDWIHVRSFAPGHAEPPEA